MPKEDSTVDAHNDGDIQDLERICEVGHASMILLSFGHSYICTLQINLPVQEAGYIV